MTEAITQMLAQGYRNILIVPIIKPASHTYPCSSPTYRVLARHWTKDACWVGERYEVGSIVDGVYYDDIPF